MNISMITDARYVALGQILHGMARGLSCDLRGRCQCNVVAWPLTLFSG